LRPCACTETAVARYRGRISGPLIDRLDLQVEVPALSFEELSSSSRGEPSATVAARVANARTLQVERAGHPNAALGSAELRRTVRLAFGARTLLAHAVDKLGVSARAHDRILKLALTIRDLEEASEARPTAQERLPIEIAQSHVAEALSYRLLDRVETVAHPDGFGAVRRS